MAAIAERRRRVAYPRWCLKALALRQLLASPLAERQASRFVPEAMRDYDRLVAERGVKGAAATERTRDLAGLCGPKRGNLYVCRVSLGGHLRPCTRH